jgi:hypothetical protein
MFENVEYKEKIKYGLFLVKYNSQLPQHITIFTHEENKNFTHRVNSTKANL